jgi:hypothetical protein
MKIGRGFAAGLVVGAMAATLAARGVGDRASAAPVEADRPDNEELARLYNEDQGDREPAGGKPINWAIVGPRDRAREARVKALFESGEIRSGKDYHRAAMVLQHAATPDDYLLAHEFCVVALAQGEREARWLAAATEDRFLMNIDRPQRFGTQYRSSGDGPMKLYRVGPGVTDALRKEMGVPTLAEARDREALMNEKLPVKAPAKP